MHLVFKRQSTVALAAASALSLAGGVAQAQTAYHFVQPSGSHRVYLDQNGIYDWVPSPALFLALGGTWGAIQPVASLPGPVGSPVTVVQQAGHHKVYTIHNGALHWIPSPTVFQQLGLQWRQIATVSRLPFPVGAPVSSGSTAPSVSAAFVQPAGSNQVYVNRHGTYHWVPSAPLFTAMGGSWGAIQSVASLPGPVGSPVTLVQRQGSSQVYQIRQQALRHIPSAMAFHQLGYHWRQVVPVSQLPYPTSSLLPSLAAAVAHQAVASTSTVQADLANPQALGELNWSNADDQMVMQALGRESAPTRTTQTYALAVLYAGLSDNWSIINGFVNGGNNGTIMLQNLPHHVSQIDHVSIAATRNAGSGHGPEYKYSVTYTTTGGQIKTIPMYVDLAYPFSSTATQWTINFVGE